MTTVVFVHGISNMPPEAELTRVWRRALATDYKDNPGLDLVEYAHVRSVHWSDVLYAEPAERSAAAESAGVSPETAQALEGGGPGIDGVDDAWLARLGRTLDFDPATLEAPGESARPSAEAVAQAAAEAIPLPWFLKKHLLRAFARDSHHYLFDVTHSPRPGETYAVRQEVRRRFVEVVSKAAGSGPVLLLTHSMGTVIGYDCLKNVDACPRVRDLVTVGSPLGLSEMQDKLDPGYSRADGYPAKVERAWVNVYDPVDIVSRADPRIANDFQRGGAAAIRDARQDNGGLWTHSMVRYAAEAPLRGVLRQMLE